MDVLGHLGRDLSGKIRADACNESGQEGFPWLEIRCARCKTPSDVDLAAMKHPPTTFVHDLASRLRCRKCAKAGRRPPATLLQLVWQPRHPRTEA
jgi:phage FluMu protein Com